MPTPAGKWEEFLRHWEDGARPFCSQCVLLCALFFRTVKIDHQMRDERHWLYQCPTEYVHMQIYLGKTSAVTGNAIVRLASTSSFSLLDKNLGTDMFLVYLIDAWLLKMRTFLKFSPIHNLMYIFS